VQGFYAHRIWQASNNVAVSGIIAVFATAAFGLGLAAATKLFINPSFARLSLPENKVIWATSHGLIMAGGVMSFAALCFYLSPSHNSAIKPVTSYFQLFMTYVFTRGSLSTIIQVCLFASFIMRPGAAIWMVFHLIATKLFLNSFLALLNAREVWQGKGLREEEVTQKRSINSSAFSGHSKPTVSSNVRFDVETKRTMNVEMTHTIDIDGKSVVTRPVYEEERHGDDWHYDDSDSYKG